MEDEKLQVVWDYFSTRESWYRLSVAIHRSFAWALDTKYTGFVHPDQLSPQIKTSIGMKIEECALSYMKLPKQKPLDTVIQGVPIDFKHSLSSSWMIPPEAVNHVCVILRSNWDDGCFDLGVLRTTEWVLRSGKNRDGKLGLRSEVVKDPAIWIRKGIPFRKTGDNCG